MKEAVELAEYLRDLGYMPEQVQDFYPTPSTISTCMYYTGYDCRTMEKVYVPINPHEKAMQRALIQYRNPKNYDLVAEAQLRSQAGRISSVLKRSASSGQEILIRVSVMRKDSMDMGQVLAAEAPDPEMKRAEMQMEKVQGEEMQVQAAETWKKAQAAK